MATAAAAASAASSGITPAAAAVAAAAAAKRPAASAQQMFQQMFALLKQMLPAEQYAALHSEMSKGNASDIKSIVDIIKRVVGDGVFSSVIQKMDLTRSFSTTATSTQNAVPMKTEPVPTSSSINASRPLTTTTGAIGQAVPLAPPASLPIAPPASVASSSVSSAIPAPASTAAQRPTLTQPAASPSVGGHSIAAATKTETETSATPSSSSSNASSSNRNDAMEKIMFAKKLLTHASTCTAASGVCQVKRCDDIRRVFKHSTSCGGARNCPHCEQLKGLVKYHAKECTTPLAEHCAIPFCDGFRKLLGTARSGAKVTTPVSTPSASTATTAGSTAEAESMAKTKTSTIAGMPKPTTPASSDTSASAKPKANVTANVHAEYGRLLQLILHVQKCTSTSCPVGEECAESKSLLRQINSPNAPARAKTYKQVYAHYKACLARNSTSTCPMCKIGLRPLLPTATATPTAAAAADEKTASASKAAANDTATTAQTASGPSAPASLKRTSSTTASPRSPSKKHRAGNNRLKAATPLPDPAQALIDQQSNELAQASVSDIRKEADVLTHTGIELGGERRVMMDAGIRRRQFQEQIQCKKEEWSERDLFNQEVLREQMRLICKRHGVEMGNHTTQVMSYALQEYLKQVVEEMVEISKQRCDAQAQSLDQLQRRELANAGTTSRPDLTATDILRVSCEDSFTRLQKDDITLRTRLLDDAKREEQAERERAKKRKKVDRSKLAQEEKDEAEMDIEELAVKDLKERLLQEDKDGIVKVEGRINDSISSKYIRRIDNQVTMEDAYYWLENQKPYVNPKLFVRAEAARIVTKSLQ